MGTLVLTDQQKAYIHHLFVDTGCCLEDLPNVMADGDGWQERAKVCQFTVMMMMTATVECIGGSKGSQIVEEYDTILVASQVSVPNIK